MTDLFIDYVKYPKSKTRIPSNSDPNRTVCATPDGRLLIWVSDDRLYWCSNAHVNGAYPKTLFENSYEVDFGAVDPPPNPPPDSIYTSGSAIALISGGKEVTVYAMKPSDPENPNVSIAKQCQSYTAVRPMDILWCNDSSDGLHFIVDDRDSHYDLCKAGAVNLYVQKMSDGQVQVEKNLKMTSLPVMGVVEGESMLINCSGSEIELYTEDLELKHQLQLPAPNNTIVSSYWLGEDEGEGHLLVLVQKGEGSAKCKETTGMMLSLSCTSKRAKVVQSFGQMLGADRELVAVDTASPILPMRLLVADWKSGLMISTGSSSCAFVIYKHKSPQGEWQFVLDDELTLGTDEGDFDSASSNVAFPDVIAFRHLAFAPADPDSERYNKGLDDLGVVDRGVVLAWQSDALIKVWKIVGHCESSQASAVQEMLLKALKDRQEDPSNANHTPQSHLNVSAPLSASVPQPYVDVSPDIGCDPQNLIGSGYGPQDEPPQVSPPQSALEEGEVLDDPEAPGSPAVEASESPAVESASRGEVERTSSGWPQEEGVQTSSVSNTDSYGSEEGRNNHFTTVIIEKPETPAVANNDSDGEPTPIRTGLLSKSVSKQSQTATAPRLIQETDALSPKQFVIHGGEDSLEEDSSGLVAAPPSKVEVGTSTDFISGEEAVSSDRKGPTTAAAAATIAKKEEEEEEVDDEEDPYRGMGDIDRRLMVEFGLPPPKPNRLGEAQTTAPRTPPPSSEDLRRQGLLKALEKELPNAAPYRTFLEVLRQMDDHVSRVEYLISVLPPTKTALEAAETLRSTVESLEQKVGDDDEVLEQRINEATENLIALHRDAELIVNTSDSLAETEVLVPQNVEEARLAIYQLYKQRLSMTDDSTLQVMTRTADILASIAALKNRIAEFNTPRVARGGLPDTRCVRPSPPPLLMDSAESNFDTTVPSKRTDPAPFSGGYDEEERSITNKSRHSLWAALEAAKEQRALLPDTSGESGRVEEEGRRDGKSRCMPGVSGPVLRRDQRAVEDVVNRTTTTAATSGTNGGLSQSVERALKNAPLSDGYYFDRVRDRLETAVEESKRYIGALEEAIGGWAASGGVSDSNAIVVRRRSDELEEGTESQLDDLIDMLDKSWKTESHIREVWLSAVEQSGF